MMKWISIVMVILAGMGLGTEAGILGPLGSVVGHYWATLCIFGLGAALLFFVSLLFGPRNPASVMSLPGWQLSGGLLGPCYVVIMTVAAPVIGITMTMTGILAGQIAKSLLIDHFGWFDGQRRPVNIRRLIALLLIAGALALIAGGN